MTDLLDSELIIFNEIVSRLKLLGTDDQKRMLETIIRFLRLDEHASAGVRSSEAAIPDSAHEKRGQLKQFSNRVELSPKEFLLEKEPKSDIERVACLAYYLTHYLDNPKFKTIDISKLNTEAAQPKFTNAAQAMKNAVSAGLIVHAAQSAKQLSAIGEQFVQALPNREEAREVLNKLRARKRRRTSKKTGGDTSGGQQSGTGFGEAIPI